MKEKEKKTSSIFDHCHETASQESFLRRCGFAQRGVPPDSDPSVEISPPLNSPRRDSETDSVTDSGFEDDLVESQAIRFVSPPESEKTVDLEEDSPDPTVVVDGGDSIASENRPSSSREDRGEGGGGKRLKVPLRDVVKAIVMNSRNLEEEEEKKSENRSYVQILMKKGFKFP